ncbi:MAG TPA: DUF4810 domain-containing protein [Candidatus Limnocylindrales bacterium]|nr:DUF4810 domain-containing protein [Candidatus Limnocylindrales bacterium]
MSPSIARRLRTALLMLLAGAATSACQPQAMYRWGGYEDVLYRSLARPDGSDTATHCAKLAADVQRTLAEGKRVPPGVHAHLGYLYYLEGSVDEARRQFDAERTAYPESAVFVDGLMARLAGAGPAAMVTSAPVATATASTPAPHNQ